jgi:ABC-type multidrug transport system fused ATPase/permease subunit
LLSKLVLLLKELWLHLTPRRKTQFFLLLCLMAIASIAESISIGAVFPLLTILTEPEIVYKSHLGGLVMSLLEIDSPNDALLPITIFFGISVLISGCIRLLLTWVSTRYAFSLGADLNIEAYKKTLYQPYEVHIGRNSNEVVNGILGKLNGIPYNVIMPALNLISSTFLLIFVFSVILYIDPIIASVCFLMFAAIYFFIGLILRRRLKANSIKIASESNRVMQLLNEGLGGIREVLIDGSQRLYTNLYIAADLGLRKSQASNSYISSSPRIIVETLGVILIAVMAYGLSQSEDGGSGGIAVIGVLALGAQRMLPNLQQIYSSWANLKGSEKSLEDSLKLLNQPMTLETNDGDKKMLFNQTITLENIFFEYQKNTGLVISDLTITIKKGSRIGFVGKTGCGKSTLMDMVMGLLSPSCGKIVIDGTPINESNRQAWRSNIAHVPQNIFLIDASISENIAFGIPRDQIDFDRVIDACRQARLDDVISKWPDKYQTNVGERGVRLSGGQRQRIGIARALYKMAEVIIFDEATSALDSQTEAEVMNAIENLGPEYTLLMVAHRVSTLKICDQIISLEGGQIKSTSSYDEYIKTNMALK